MSTDTPISWADHSLGVHYGCTKISAGCRDCYATGFVHRLQANPHVAYLNNIDPVTRDHRTWTGRIVFRPEALEVPRRTRQAARWFVSSLSDTFHPRIPDREIAGVFAMAADCATSTNGGPGHQFQVLTKRPERAAELLADPAFVTLVDHHRRYHPHTGPVPWPLPNVWLGATIEHDNTAHRADALRQTPAGIRWVSAEPLLGPLDTLNLDGIDWVVVGGENSTRARPCDLNWIRRLHHRCSTAGVAFHVKQLGTVQARTMHLTGRAGNRIEEFPPDLRIQTYPDPVPTVAAVVGVGL
jgi:protein gp37